MFVSEYIASHSGHVWYWSHTLFDREVKIVTLTHPVPPFFDLYIVMPISSVLRPHHAYYWECPVPGVLRSHMSFHQHKCRAPALSSVVLLYPSEAFSAMIFSFSFAPTLCPSAVSCLQPLASFKITLSYLSAFFLIFRPGHVVNFQP